MAKPRTPTVTKKQSRGSWCKGRLTLGRSKARFTPSGQIGGWGTLGHNETADSSQPSSTVPGIRSSSSEPLFNAEAAWSGREDLNLRPHRPQHMLRRAPRCRHRMAHADAATIDVPEAKAEFLRPDLLPDRRTRRNRVGPPHAAAYATDSRSGSPVVMARPEGFEPPTPWSEATCSGPLSYGRADRG